VSKIDIVRAWKDAQYRQHLSAEEQVMLPEHPAGSIELTAEELSQAAGAAIIASQGPFTEGCCATIFFTTPCCPTAAFTATCCPNFNVA